MKLVMLYGPPAAGKFTVAQEVAARTGFKLLHNHLTFDLYASIFPIGTPLFRRLVEGTRIHVVEEAAQYGIAGMILTTVYEEGQDEPFHSRLITTVEKYGGSVHLVQLTCSVEELQRRVVSESRRTFKKLNSVEGLQKNMQGYNLFAALPQQPSLCIDNTNLSPQHAAQQIIEHYQLQQ